jgi:hypothetical protein
MSFNISFEFDFFGGVRKNGGCEVIRKSFYDILCV